MLPCPAEAFPCRDQFTHSHTHTVCSFFFVCFEQVLVYKGKVLNDGTSLKDNNITEDGFMVVTVLKGKAPAKKEAVSAPWPRGGSSLYCGSSTC